MKIKFVVFILIFYFLALFQTSFLPYFGFLGIFSNLIFILIILMNLFEKSAKRSGFVIALIGGLFMDIFSSGFFGFYTLLSLSIPLFIKFVLRKYVKIPAIQRI